MRRLVPSLCLALLGSGLSAARAADEQPSAQVLFEQMAEATRTRNYDGIFVYTRGVSADSMRIIHRADDAGEQERIVSLSGPLREVVRNNETVKCFYPENRSVLVEKSLPRKFLPSFSGTVEDIAQNYQFALLGRDRVADRRAWVVGVLPRNAYRYGYRFWIDVESQLLLRSEVLNSRGAVLEQIQFTQLSLPESIAEELLQPGIDSRSYKLLDNRAASSTAAIVTPSEEGWKVRWVPEGFAQREYRIQQLATSNQPVEHIIFSDGLATISVFIEKLAEFAGSLQGFTAIGAINTFSAINNNYQVTVIGEVPPLTVRQVAGSVAPVIKSAQ